MNYFKSLITLSIITLGTLSFCSQSYGETEYIDVREKYKHEHIIDIEYVEPKDQLFIYFEDGTYIKETDTHIGSNGYYYVTKNTWLKNHPKTSLIIDNITYINARTKYADQDVIDFELIKDPHNTNVLKVYFRDNSVISEPTVIIENDTYFVPKKQLEKIPSPQMVTLDGTRYIAIRSVFAHKDVIDFVFTKDDAMMPLGIIYCDDGTEFFVPYIEQNGLYYTPFLGAESASNLPIEEYLDIKEYYHSLYPTDTYNCEFSLSDNQQFTTINVYNKDYEPIQTYRVKNARLYRGQPFMSINAQNNNALLQRLRHKYNDGNVVDINYRSSSAGEDIDAATVYFDDGSQVNEKSVASYYHHDIFVSTAMPVPYFPQKTLTFDNNTFINARAKYAHQSVTDIAYNKENNCLIIYFDDGTRSVESTVILQSDHYFVPSEIAPKLELPQPITVDGVDYTPLRSQYLDDDIMDITYTPKGANQYLFRVYFDDQRECLGTCIKLNGVYYTTK